MFRPTSIVGLLGSADDNLRALERTLAADLHARGNTSPCPDHPPTSHWPSAWSPS